VAKPSDVLRANTEAARRLSEKVGPRRVQSALSRADKDLSGRLREAVAGPGDKSFTHAQLTSTLRQVRHVLRNLGPRLEDATVETAGEAAEAAAGGALEYLDAADSMFRGVGTQALALDEASVLDAATSGAESSVLRRLASGEGAAKEGILQRYGMNVIGNFEEQLQTGLLARRSWDQMRGSLIERSPFLQGAPASWAERIVRTETMNATNLATWEATREADDQLGDVVKILVATFDARTASDSYAVHGQIRRPEEAFETWYGMMQHPPARPNDREIIVMHRIAWAIPPEYAIRDPGQIASRWKAEGRKGRLPERPLMTTVDLSSFGAG
jgi:hypothetical protein